MAGDATPDWDYIKSIITTNVMYLEYTDFYGHNDMDMMEIGNGNLTVQEQRTHFAAWCFLKSPILLGTEVSLVNANSKHPANEAIQLSQLTKDELAIIKNTELLAFSQDDIVGTPATPFTPYAGAPSTTPLEYYSGKSSKGIHVFIINSGDVAANKTFNFANVDGLSGTGSYVVHDMWNGTDLGTFSGNYTTSVDAHDTVAFFVQLVTPSLNIQHGNY